MDRVPYDVAYTFNLALLHANKSPATEILPPSSCVYDSYTPEERRKYISNLIFDAVLYLHKQGSSPSDVACLFSDGDTSTLIQQLTTLVRFV